MTQKELNRKVASQTGENIETINALGFSPLKFNIPIEERHEPLTVDWDELDRNPTLRRVL